MSLFSLIEDIPVAVIDRQTLDACAQQRGGRVDTVGQRGPDKALRVLTSDGNVKEVWVKPHPKKQKYKYRAVWIDVFGHPNNYLGLWNRVTGQIRNEPVQVDHLLSETLADKLQYAYVRLFPVLGSVNTHFGRSMEGAVVRNSSPGNVAGRINYRNGIEYMDILSFGKALNFSLTHALYSGATGNPALMGNTGPNRNEGFLSLWGDETRTRVVLREIGLIWWL